MIAKSAVQRLGVQSRGGAKEEPLDEERDEAQDEEDEYFKQVAPEKAVGGVPGGLGLSRGGLRGARHLEEARELLVRHVRELVELLGHGLLRHARSARDHPLHGLEHGRVGLEHLERRLELGRVHLQQRRWVRRVQPGHWVRRAACAAHWHPCPAARRRHPGHGPAAAAASRHGAAHLIHLLRGHVLHLRGGHFHHLRVGRHHLHLVRRLLDLGVAERGHLRVGPPHHVRVHVPQRVGLHPHPRWVHGRHGLGALLEHGLRNGRPAAAAR
mmetsp:Transcript_20960/g.47308  ORF Transcript_20960/g.47308 Transcript_20960/m.47308 type:complete len:270 (+) Transcript_20960:122-931(+)